MATTPEAVLLSLGSINADFQLRVDEAPGRVETQRGHDLQRLAGGKAVNVARIARRLGHTARLLGRVGGDDLAEQVLRPLAHEGLETGGICRARGEQTAVAMIAVPPDGKKRIILLGNANLGFDHEDVAQVVAAVDRAPRGSALVVDYEISPAAASAAVVAAAERGLPVVVDPSFPDAVPHEDLQRMHAITPNADEAVLLAGLRTDLDAGGADEATLTAALRELLARGPRLVCIKLEDGGCLWSAGGDPRLTPAPEVHVVDSTGAGDAFTAALAVAMLEGEASETAVRRAVAASTLAVGVYSSAPGRPRDHDDLLQHTEAVPPTRPWGKR